MSDSYRIVQTKDVLPDTALPPGIGIPLSLRYVRTSLDQLGCLGINVEPIAT